MSNLTKTREDKLTLEQRNRVLRAHKKPILLTKEEAIIETNRICEDIETVVDLELLCNSIKTYKLVEQLQQLLKHPRNDVLHAAKRLSKITAFKKVTEPVLTKEQLLELLKKEHNCAESAVLFTRCAEHKMFLEFYQQSHKMELDNFNTNSQNMVNRSQIEKQCLAAIEEDFKVYQKNIKAVAFEDAAIDKDVIARLRFAAKLVEEKKYVEFMKLYGLEVAKLTTRYQSTVREIIDTFKLYKNNKLSVDNLNQADDIISVRLFAKGKLQDLAIRNGDIVCQNIDSLKASLTKALKCLSTVTEVNFYEIDRELISEDMAFYHAHRSYELYEQRAEFMDQWRQSDKKDKTPELKNLDLTWENVEQARKFILENPSYQATQSQPVYVVLQSKQIGDALEKYPNGIDRIESIFEKNLMNKKDRFLNGDTRVWVLKALLIGAFIHGDPDALQRIVRLIGQQCQITTNSVEKQRNLEVLEPHKLFAMVLIAHQKGIFRIDLRQYCKDLFYNFFKTPDMLSANITNFNTQFMPCALQAMFDYYPTNQIGQIFQDIFEISFYIYQTLPSIKAQPRKIVILLPVGIRQFVTFDMSSVYETKEGVTSIGNIAALSNNAKDVVQLKESIAKLLNKAFETEVRYFTQISEQLFPVLPAIQEKQLKLKDATAEQLLQLKTEQAYVKLFTDMVNCFAFRTCAPDKLRLSVTLPKEPTREIKALYAQFNTHVSQLQDDYRLMSETTGLLGDFTRQQLSLASNFVFMATGKDITYCNSHEAVKRFFEVQLRSVKYATSEYKKNYDETQLASTFKLLKIENMYKFVIMVFGAAVKEISCQERRYDKLKRVTAPYIAIFKELERENIHQQEYFNAFYTQQFQRAAPASKTARRGVVKRDFGVLGDQLKNLTFALNIALKKIAPHQMLDILGDMLCSQVMGPMAIHIVTHLEPMMKHDPKASLDDLFAKPMPMSSLKTLIKSYFRSQEIVEERINELFKKSSIDGKVCILEHFYYRAVTDTTQRELFAHVVTKSCKSNPDVMIQFFGSVYNIEDNLEYNKTVLDLFKPIIETEKMSPYMMNFAAYLKKSYDIPFQRAISGFRDISIQDKTCAYILIYLLKNYQDKIKEISKVIVDRFYDLKRKSFESSVLYKSLEGALKNADEYEVITQSAAVYIATLRAQLQKPFKTELRMDIDISKLPCSQIVELIDCEFQKNTIACHNLSEWNAIYERRAEMTPFVVVMANVMRGIKVPAADLENLSSTELMVLKRTAVDEDYEILEEESSSDNK